jgi:hypothetical protein
MAGDDRLGLNVLSHRLRLSGDTDAPDGKLRQMAPRESDRMYNGSVWELKVETG